MQTIKQFIANQKIYIVTLLAPIIILGSILVIFNIQQKPDDKKDVVLGAQIVKPTVTPTPTPTLNPTATVVPTGRPRTFVPTKTPTPIKSGPTPTPTSTPSSNSQNASPTATPTPGQSTNTNPTETPTPTPTPVVEQVTVKAGADTWTTTLNAGETAFDVVKRAVGDGLTYDTYECCGAFISGFHGEHAVYPQWWEFVVNGASSSVGVSGYNPVSGDVLEFVYHE